MTKKYFFYEEPITASRVARINRKQRQKLSTSQGRTWIVGVENQFLDVALVQNINEAMK